MVNVSTFTHLVWYSVGWLVVLMVVAWVDLMVVLLCGTVSERVFDRER